MARLFGREMTRAEILERVGDVSQVAGLRRTEAVEGRGKGVGLVECWTGSGLRFTVALDRGLDIPFASMGGLPLAWHGPPGLVAPPFYEPEGLGWLWTFPGGLLTTCGLQHAGAPSDLADDPHGLHGRVSHIPADTIALDTRWDDDDYVMRISGTVRETRVFGPQLLMERTLTARMGESAVLVEDVVTNAGYTAQPHMILYHFNLGWPLLSEETRLVIRPRSVEPRDADAADGAETWDQFQPPTAEYREKVYFITPEPDAGGRVTAALVNPSLHGGLGVELAYPAAALPKFVEWKMMGRSHYVVGMEPANCLIHPRSELLGRGEMPVLEAGASRRYSILLRVLTGTEATAYRAPR